jgi:hypothetical protein
MQTRFCQILQSPITISIKPRDLVLLKDLRPSLLGPQWTSPHLVILTMPTTVKLIGIPQWQYISSINIAPKLQAFPLRHRMSTLVYCSGPCGYTSPTNSLPLPLLHKLLVLIWLSIYFPFTAQKSSSCDPSMHIVWAEIIVTKTSLFHTYYSCVGSVIT